MADAKRLEGISVMEGIPTEELTLLAEIARDLPTARGDRLVTQGGPAETLYIAHTGEYALAITLAVSGEDRETRIETKVSGDAFGWSALVRPHRALYTVVCTVPGSVVAFAQPDLFKLFDASPRLGYRLMGNVAGIVARRLELMQTLWIDEVQQTRGRVNYWLKHGIDI